MKFKAFVQAFLTIFCVLAAAKRQGTGTFIYPAICAGLCFTSFLIAIYLINKNGHS